MSEHFEQKKVNARVANRLVYEAAGHARIASVELQPAGDRQVCLETMYSGISRGTERLVFQGLIPASERQSMKCPHQWGEFSFPVSYGYSLVGRVVEIGKKVTMVREGDIVFVLHPHQDRIIVDEICCHVLPQCLPPERAVLAANSETALNAVWDAGLNQGDNVAVFGAGVVGLLVAAFAAESVSGKITVFDIDGTRRKIVEDLGFCFAPSAGVGKGGSDFDCIFNTSASGAALQEAINHAAFEGRIIELSWYGDKPVELCLGARFHSRRLKIVSSQVGSVSPQKRENVSSNARLGMAMNALCDPRFDQLLEPAISFRSLPDSLPSVFGDNKSLSCQLVSYTEN